MAGSNSSFQTPATVADCGAQWAFAQGAGAVVLWRFAQSLLRFTVANPKVKLADIGAACAIAAKRATPYSKPWVSRAIKAARAIATEPNSPADATKFMDLFNGRNESAKAKAKKTGSADDALRGAIAFARLAVKRGLDADSVAQTVADALTEEDAGEGGAQRKAA